MPVSLRAHLEMTQYSLFDMIGSLAPVNVHELLLEITDYT